jgi:hypothetical protein
MYTDLKHVNLHSDKMYLKLELKNFFSRQKFGKFNVTFFLFPFLTRFMPRKGQPNHTRHLQLSHVYSASWYTGLGVYDIRRTSVEKRGSNRYFFLLFSTNISFNGLNNQHFPDYHMCHFFIIIKYCRISRVHVTSLIS